MARVKWRDPLTGKRAQFIADVIRESLFDYSFDSNKIPSLNLHYFCNDYMVTYSLVKRDVVRSGNLIPLNEEFENIIETAPWLPQGITKTMFFFRGKTGEYQDTTKDKNIDELKRGEFYYDCTNYIDTFLSGNNGYYKQLLEEIKRILFAATFDTNDQRRLYYCVREAICELVNHGVSKNHIYNITERKLFSRIKSKDDYKYILDFLESLTPISNKYHVIFGVSEETFSELCDSIKIMRKATDEEKGKLETKYVVALDINSYDPVSALEGAKDIFLMLLSIYNSFVHSDSLTIVSSGLVKKEGEPTYKKIRSSAGNMKRNQIKPKKDRIKMLNNVLAATRSDPITSSFELHNIAVTSENPETQLLMLWTIFELLIETNQDNMSKVNFITNAVTSILCVKYYQHILEALYKQITTTQSVKPIIQKETRGKTNIEKLAFILKDNTVLQNEILTELSSFPLESFKVNHYAEIFSSNESLKNDLKRHSKRLRWQMMRIYRNRCMIVHDGSHLPYINNIIENLHFYVDDLLEYMILCFENGFINPRAILSDARIKEKHIFDVLSDKTNTISDQDFVGIVCFNNI